jgi:integrase/recombinase XerD
MLFSTAIEGFSLYMRAGAYSPGTERNHRDNLVRLKDYLGDPQVESVTLADLQRFIAWLKKDYVPKRFSRDTSPVSPAHVDNHWKAIRSFFRWAEIDLQIKRPDDKLQRPRFKDPEIKPFTESEIKLMLRACEYSAEVKRANNQVAYRLHRPTATRDKAIIMVLLDTGLRIGELSRLKVEDVDLTTGACLVAPFRTGRKTKPRTVYLGKLTLRTVWLYLAKRKDYKPDDPLIPINPNAVRLLFKAVEARSGVRDVHPHRFRHTFAISFLRNRGDVFTLQRMLGHSSLDMVRRYLRLVDGDVQDAHRRASPVDNMKL